MLRWFLDWLKPKSYRIVQDPSLGYIPEYWDKWYWRVIDKDGVICLHHCHAVHAVWHWTKNKTEAGARINLHARSRGQKVIRHG